MSTQSDSSQCSPLALNAELLIGDIATLKTQLVDALQGGAELRIDPTSVKTADTATLQLLAAFVNRANEFGKPVSWCGFSEVLTNAASLLGLRRHLGLTASDEKN